MLSEAVRQEENLENVFEVASKELQTVDQVSDCPVDDDWLTRFTSHAKDISSKDMQFIWGKILSGEIAKPGSFSVRTLDTLRNINRYEAELFNKVMQYMVYDGNIVFTSSNNELLNKYGVYYSDIMKLDECGLINSSGTISINLFLHNNRKSHFYTNSRVLLLEVNGENIPNYSVGIHSLTTAGRELFLALEQSANDNFFEDFTDDIKKQNRNANVDLHLHKVTSIQGSIIHYNSEPIKSIPWTGSKS